MAKTERRAAPRPETDISKLAKKEPATAGFDLGSLSVAGEEAEPEQEEELTPAQRKALRDQRRKRKSYDAQEDQYWVLKNLARELSVPESELAFYLMMTALDGLTLEELKHARAYGKKSLQADFTIQPAKIPAWCLFFAKERRYR
jgi:hypothetical protein